MYGCMIIEVVNWAWEEIADLNFGLVTIGCKQYFDEIRSVKTVLNS